MYRLHSVAGRNGATLNLGVSNGARGPVKRLTWCRLFKGDHGNLIARVLSGEPDAGKIVIDERYSSFLGHEGQLTLLGITAEVEQSAPPNQRSRKTRFYGKHAEISRWWSTDQDDRDPEPWRIDVLLSTVIVNAKDQMEATLRMIALIEEAAQRSHFQRKLSKRVYEAMGPWRRVDAWQRLNYLPKLAS